VLSTTPAKCKIKDQGESLVATVILDTNVFLHSPNALKAFKKCDIVIPLCVIEELDNQKRRQDDAGRNARKAIKTIDQLQTTGGMKLPHGVRVRIETRKTDLPHIIDLDGSKIDNQIIALAVSLRGNGEDVKLISNDGACRVKARYFGIPSEEFEQDRVQVNVEEVYSGVRGILVPGKVIDGFYKSGETSCLEEETPFENQFVILRDECNPKHSALAKYTSGKFVALQYANSKPWDISPRNVEQTFFLEALMDPKIQLVTAIGTAGTGKTLMAIASSMYQVTDTNTYNKLVYYKSIVPIGPDMGALPGDMDDKLKPWMGSAYDAFEYLLGDTDQLQDLISDKKVELSSLTYIRGRSLPKLFLIVDECANLTPNEVKTLISRAGEDTKVVLIGDPYQIDHPYLDSQNNGLVYTVERFKGQKEYAHVTLTKAERSRLSGLAAELL
jgi:PhoH-like ATPase